MASESFLLVLTAEDRVTPVLREIGELLADPRVMVAFGAGLDAEELRRHGPGFEVRPFRGADLGA